MASTAKALEPRLRHKLAAPWSKGVLEVLSSDLDDATLVESDRAPAHQPYEFSIVRGYEHRRPTGVDLAEQVHDLQETNPDRDCPSAHLR